MNIIAVDDEKILLADIERTIRSVIPDADVKGFRKPKDALEYVKSALANGDHIDIAFLDIEMAGMNGLELAKKLKDINGKTNIVFVTGYSDHAVDAFALQASGYVLKPVTKEVILREINNLRYPVKENVNIKIDTNVRAKTFGNFDVFVEDKMLVFGRLKAKEAFAYLVDRKGSSVTTAEIASILWEERDYDRSLQNQTQVIISSMMKTLKENDISDIIIKNRNQIAIDKSKIKCDYYDFLNWDISAVNAYEGEYMTNYSWAEMTAGELYMRNGKR